MIKVDMTSGDKLGIRGALGSLPGGKPEIYFFDRQGRLLGNATLEGWAGADADDPMKAAATAWHKRVDLALGETQAASATRMTPKMTPEK